jgi:hypothetical protein
MLAAQPTKAPTMIHIKKLIIFFSWVNYVIRESV